MRSRLSTFSVGFLFVFGDLEIWKITLSYIECGQISAYRIVGFVSFYQIYSNDATKDDLDMKKDEISRLGRVVELSEPRGSRS